MYTEIMTLRIKQKFEEVDVDGGKCKGEGKVKVVPVLNELSTTPKGVWGIYI
jgi:hypothetical protein